MFGGLAAGLLWFVLSEWFIQRQRFTRNDIFSTSNIKQPPTRRRERIDAILDKINRSGYDSLTQAEKEELFRQSKNK